MPENGSVNCDGIGGVNSGGRLVRAPSVLPVRRAVRGKRLGKKEIKMGSLTGHAAAG